MKSDEEDNNDHNMALYCNTENKKKQQQKASEMNIQYNILVYI